MSICVGLGSLTAHKPHSVFVGPGSHRVSEQRRHLRLGEDALRPLLKLPANRPRDDVIF